MKVLVADPFEQSGLDGLRAAGCEVVHDPALKDEALAAALGETRAEVLVVRSTKVTAEMLDAGQPRADRPGRRRLQHDRRGGRVGARHLRLATAPARTRSRWRSSPWVSSWPSIGASRTTSPNCARAIGTRRSIASATRPRTARRWGSSASAASPRRSPGAPRRSACTSSSGRAGSPRQPDVDFAAYGLESDARIARDDRAVAGGRRGAGGHPEHPPGARPRDARPRGRGRPRPPSAGRVRHQHRRAPRSSTTTPWPSRSASAASASAWTSTRTSPTTGTAEFSLPLLQEPGVYGTHHIGASTDQAQEAIAAETVRIVRSFKETGRVPNVVNLARRTPGDATCSSCATGTGRACSRTSSST